MLKSLICTFALAAIAGSAGWASESVKNKVVVVRTADLNLATAEGRAVLARRINKAVVSVCGWPNRASYVDLAENRACHAALTRAARQKARVLIARRSSAEVLASH